MSNISLFNIPTNRAEAPPADVDGVPGADSGQPLPQEVGVVTSSQATITFAAAPVAVTIVWKVLSNVSSTVAGWTWFPVVLSLIVGMAIYSLAPASGTWRQKGIAFFFALINSFAIAATTLGIDTAVTPKDKPVVTQTSSNTTSLAEAASK